MSCLTWQRTKNGQWSILGVCLSELRLVSPCGSKGTRKRLKNTTLCSRFDAAAVKKKRNAEARCQECKAAQHQPTNQQQQADKQQDKGREMGEGGTAKSVTQPIRNYQLSRRNSKQEVRWLGLHPGWILYHASLSRVVNSPGASLPITMQFAQVEPGLTDRTFREQCPKADEAVIKI